jgi:hypothetical protein
MVICRDLTDNDETWGYYIMGTTIWPLNIAMDNDPFIDDRNDESSMSSSDCAVEARSLATSSWVCSPPSAMRAIP